MSKIFISITLTILCNALGSLYAMEMNIWKACDSGNTKRVKLLIEQDNTLVNTPTLFSSTPLHHASNNGHLKTAALLLQYKADVDAQSHFGWTPLHCASRWGYTEIAALLLQHEADVNAQDDDRWTPLYCASNGDRTEAMKLLLSYGATPHKPINLFFKHEQYSQIYAEGYESWLCKTFVSCKVIVTLLSLIGRRKITDTPLLPKDMRNLIADYAISDQEREREKSSQNSGYEDPVQEWEEFKKDNPDVAELARIELP